MQKIVSNWIHESPFLIIRQKIFIRDMDQIHWENITVIWEKSETESEIEARALTPGIVRSWNSMTNCFWTGLLLSLQKKFLGLKSEEFQLDQKKRNNKRGSTRIINVKPFKLVENKHERCRYEERSNTVFEIPSGLTNRSRPDCPGPLTRLKSGKFAD